MANKKRRRRPPGGPSPTATAPARSDDAERRASKAARRAQREAQLKLDARRRRATRFITVAVVVLVGLVAVQVFGRSKSPTTPARFASVAPVDPSSLPGIQTGDAPWTNGVGASSAPLTARLKAIGLSPLGSEGSALHIHQHLDIFVNGNAVEVPAGIGIGSGPSGTFFSPLHTHDTSGVIHVESATQRTYTLGEFFDVWGVRLTPQCIGGYCADATTPLSFYVDGHEVTGGDPRNLVLFAHEEIAIVVGSPPAEIPSSFTFPLLE